MFIKGDLMFFLFLSYFKKSTNLSCANGEDPDQMPGPGCSKHR